MKVALIQYIHSPDSSSGCNHLLNYSIVFRKEPSGPLVAVSSEIYVNSLTTLDLPPGEYVVRTYPQSGFISSSKEFALLNEDIQMPMVVSVSFVADGCLNNGGDTPPGGGDTPPDGGDTPPGGGDTPPDGGDTPPGGGDTDPNAGGGGGGGGGTRRDPPDRIKGACVDCPSNWVTRGSADTGVSFDDLVLIPVSTPGDWEGCWKRDSDEVRMGVYLRSRMGLICPATNNRGEARRENVNFDLVYITGVDSRLATFGVGLSSPNLSDFRLIGFTTVKKGITKVTALLRQRQRVVSLTAPDNNLGGLISSRCETKMVSVNIPSYPSGDVDYEDCLKSGCTNPHAVNYDPEANEDDGGCITCANAGLCVVPDPDDGENCNDVGNGCCDEYCLTAGDCSPSFNGSFTASNGIYYPSCYG